MKWYIYYCQVIFYINFAFSEVLGHMHGKWDGKGTII